MLEVSENIKVKVNLLSNIKRLDTVEHSLKLWFLFSFRQIDKSLLNLSSFIQYDLYRFVKFSRVQCQQAKMEVIPGVEPGSQDSESWVLPLHHTTRSDSLPSFRPFKHIRWRYWRLSTICLRGDICDAILSPYFCALYQRIEEQFNYPIRHLYRFVLMRYLC